MEKKRQVALIYFDTNKILFYAKNFKSALEIPLSSDIISDLEVIDGEKLESVIDNFFLTNNLKELEYESILIFSENTTFDKDLEDGDSKFKYEETQKFLDMVPFEDMFNNSYTIGKKTKIVAVNKVLFEKLRYDFEKNKAYILAAVPMSVLKEINPTIGNNLDLPAIATKYDSIKQFNLVGLSEREMEGEVKNSMGIKKKDLRLFALIVVFIVLLMVLVYMLYTTFFTSKPKPKINNPVIKKSLISPTPIVIASSSSALESTPSAKDK